MASKQMHVLVGLVVNNTPDCMPCNSIIGFVASIIGCDGHEKKKVSGNRYFSGGIDVDISAFGYILVQ